VTPAVAGRAAEAIRVRTTTRPGAAGVDVTDLYAIVDGDRQGDPIAAAEITGHWLAAASGAAGQLAPVARPRPIDTHLVRPA